nr:immunoglobulin light chain junction region [Macaca mulatta]
DYFCYSTDSSGYHGFF